MTNAERAIQDLQYEVRRLRELLALKDEAYAALEDRVQASKIYDEWLKQAHADICPLAANKFDDKMGNPMEALERLNPPKKYLSEKYS